MNGSPGNRSQIVTFVLLIVLLAPACARREPTASTPLPEARATPGPTDNDRSTSPPAERGAPGATPASDNNSTAPPAASDVPAARRANVKPADGASPGDNAYIYLSARVPRLVVEIDAVRGKAPSEETLGLLETRLTSVADKPGGIVFRRVQEIAPGDGDWSVEELRRAEQRNRTTHSTTDTASMYLVFVDGRPPEDDVIGVAYGASSAALFSDQVDSAATVLVSAQAIEAAATVHEVGHLLSLVNLGYVSPRDHEDPDHRGHSDNEDSVMYWAVDNVGVVDLLGGRTAPSTGFDADDRADLTDVGAGRLGTQNR